ncbi:MAG TPA: DUF4369 domain-containing protein [Mediterranea massiliensis]|uniref:DUF4369 domain-containing protein n=1 Tax=Mediterranea massiliensis TaxID=1841865 RepID=A0A921I045_9BACT|nr:DUF4369 domain-containing protein [Mediterranea massiliensis]MBM6733741.1 DUF4369 domain-containing protein [Mediterranea massiliensis]CCZ48390.1 uncharacterized protein BN750_00354 [Bacteroides sp. CAG:661]HJF93021.1 DUF4369 domain-containing protein [Mediterranea massiliensis]
MKYKMFVHYAFPLLALLLCASCSRGYRIEGQSSVTSLDGKMLYLKTLQDGDWVAVDSAEVIHGLFKMKGPVDSVRMVTLYMGDEGLMPLVLENGHIRVDIANVQMKAEGTPLNDKLYEFIDKRNALELAIEEVDRKEARMVLDGVALDDIHDQLQQESDSLVGAMNTYLKQFIADNYENVLGPSVFMMMCSTLPYPVMTPNIEAILKDAPASFKDNVLVKDYVSKAKENMKLIEEHKRLQQNVAATRP